MTGGWGLPSTMFLDVARHKLYEALVTLVAVAVTIVVATVAMPTSPLSHSAAPLTVLLGEWQLSHPIVAAIVSLALLLRLAFMATRSAVRTHLYGVNSFATMTLAPLAIMALADRGAILSTMLLAWLVVETLRRLFFAFGSEERLHAIFTAMLAIGAMPLLDSALSVFVLALPMVLISLRVGGREAIIAIVGALLPIFSYAYISWCCGANFVDTIVAPFEAIVEPSGMDMPSYLAMPRMAVLVTLVVMTLASIALFLRYRLALTLVARHAWRFVVGTLILLVASAVLLPSVTPATIMTLGVVVSVILPMLMLRLSTLISIALYILLVCGSLATLFAS